MNWKLIRRIDAIIGIPLLRLCSFFNNDTQARSEITPKRILLIKFWGIGNLFLLLPSIRSLRETFPDADIDFLTLKSNVEALSLLQVAHRVSAIDTATPLSFVSSWSRAVKGLASRQYDLIIDFEQFARFSALVASQIGAASSIGFMTAGQKRHHLYARPVPYDNAIHVTRSFHRLVEEAGTPATFPTGEHIPDSEAWRRRGAEIIQEIAPGCSAPTAVMHIGTSDNFKERRWPAEHHAVVARHLVENRGFRVFLTGLDDEAGLTADTAKRIGHPDAVFDMGGKLSFTGYVSLIATAAIVISADTAAVHIASALGTPVIGLYGPNTPHLYGPWGDHGKALYADFDCSPCITNFNGKLNTCRHPDGRGACMSAITPDTVILAIDELFGGEKRLSP